MEIMDKSSCNVTHLPIENNQQLPKAQPETPPKPATFMCGGLRNPYLVIYSGKNPFGNAL